VKFKTWGWPLYVGSLQRYIKADLAINAAFANSVVTLGVQNVIAELSGFLA
jgi:hypothetical protein